MIIFGYVCDAAMYGVSAWVIYWMIDEFIEAGQPELDRLHTPMAVRKER
jgi:hypothetical protein